MVNLQKEINYAPEGKGGGNGGDKVGGKVAKILDFGPVFEDRNRQRNITRDFDSWCLDHKKIVEQKSIRDKIKPVENGVFFSTKSGSVFLPYGLGEVCSYKDANKNYSAKTIFGIFEIFGNFDRFMECDANDATYNFFIKVLKWNDPSLIWVTKNNEQTEDNSLLYRVQGLTYDEEVIGGNIPDSSGGDQESIEFTEKDGLIVWFAGFRIAIIDPNYFYRSSPPEKIPPIYSFPQ